MQRISNDIFPSTTHRVSQPRDAAARQRPRVSFPMAIYLWEDEVLEVLPGLEAPKYPPIKAIHFHTRITSKFYGDDYAVGDPAALAGSPSSTAHQLSETDQRQRRERGEGDGRLLDQRSDEEKHVRCRGTAAAAPGRAEPGTEPRVVRRGA